MLGRGADGVEEQLAVLAADVALPDARVAGQHVVAVVDAGPREGAVVEPEQADHPVRHRAHRHERGHGQRAGAEVRPRRAARAAARRAARARPRARGGRPRRAAGVARGVGELRPRLAGLPRVGGGGGGQRVQRVRSGRRPTRRAAARRLNVGERRAEPVDELREPADPVDVAGLDVVERQRRAQPATGPPSPPRAAAGPAPRPRCSAGSRRAGTARRCAASRPHRTPAAGDQVAQPGHVVGVEAEPAPDRRPAASRSSTSRRRQPGVGQLEQRADDVEQRVDLPQRPVGEPDGEPVAGVRPPSIPGVEPEDGRHERGERLDVRAADEDVARLERRVVGEQAEHDLAQHLDLPVRAVAGVHRAPTGRRGPGRGRPRARGRRAGRAAGGRAAWTAAGRGRRGGGRRRRAASPAAAAARGRRGPARRAGGGGRRPRWGRPGARAARRRAAGAPRARGRGAAATGARRGAGPSAASTARWSAGSRVGPNSDSRAGRSARPGSAAARHRGGEALGRVRPDARPQAAPQLGLPAPGRRGTRGVVAARARRRAAPAGGWRSRRTAPARCAAAANRLRARRPGAPAAPRTTARPAHPSSTSSSGHTARAGCHGSSSGATPVAAPTAAATTSAGEGNATCAQTPSPLAGRCRAGGPGVARASARPRAPARRRRRPGTGRPAGRRGRRPGRRPGCPRARRGAGAARVTDGGRWLGVPRGANLGAAHRQLPADGVGGAARHLR